MAEGEKSVPLSCRSWSVNPSSLLLAEHHTEMTRYGF